MAIAERVNRRLLGLLGFWDKGILLLFLAGSACTAVAVCLHYAFLKPHLENGFQAALLALLFDGSRVTLLAFAGLADCVDRASTRAMGRVFFAASVGFSVISALMNLILVFHSDIRPLGFQELFTGGSLILALLVIALELCLFAGFWLPIALHAQEIRSILERKRIEEEAVIAYIYELRAQRIREGRVDLAGTSLLLRLKTLFMQKQKEISHEPID